MRGIFKKLGTTFLAICLVIAMLPLKVFAEETTTGENINVRVSVENTTFLEDKGNGVPAFTGELVSTDVQIPADSTAYDAFKAAMDKEKIEIKGSSSYISAIGGLSEFDGGSASGWMFTVNDWFTNVGAGSYKVEDNDEIRFMYTCSYGSDLGGTYGDSNKTLKDLKTDVGTLSPAFSSDIKEYELKVPQGTKQVVVTPTATNKNFQVRASVGDTEYKRIQAIPVENGTIITVKCGDPSWPSMNSTTTDAQIYKLKIVEQGETPAVEYKLNLSADPQEGGTVDVATTTYDADYNDTTTKDEGITSKEIDFSEYKALNSEWRVSAKAKDGYEFKGWKIGDTVYDSSSDLSSIDAGGLLVDIDKDTNDLFLFNYNENGIVDISNDVNISAVFEKTTSNQDILNDFVSNNLDFYKLRPQFGTDTNVVTMLNNYIESKDSEHDITATLKSTDDTEYVKEDGTISYYDNFDFSGFASIYQANVGLTFTLSLGDASVDVDTKALIGWDADKVRAKMNEEIDANLTEDKMKGENTDLQNVETDLVLPQILGSTYKQSLSQISWKSSNTDVIAIQDGEGYTYPDYIGKVTQPTEDTEITLTATFKFTKTNSSLEKDITFTKDYKVLVKAKKIDEEAVKKAMLEELNSKYTADLLKDFNTKEVIDINNVTGDIQLPRPSKIGLVNKEIKVTSSDESLLKINGYRIYTYQPVGEDKTVDLIITMTRDGLSVEKRITLTIKQVSPEEIQNEIKLMEAVKEHYFDGINDGSNTDKDNVINNLHAFKEVSLNEDGSLKWVYDVKDETGNGIEPVAIDPSDNMGISGYNLFYTSNNAVVSYENLLVNRPEKDTQITIKSVLSSKKFAKYAEMYPDNKDLQKLYRQEVETTITVKGTKQTVNVTFDNDGEKTVKEATIGEALDYRPEAPTKEGYTFVGWYKDTDDITTEYKSGATYDQDVTYKAKWAHVEMLGAQAKKVVDDKSGIRFGTKIYNDGDEIVEKGTLILPVNLLAEGETLTVDNKLAARSIGKVNYEENEKQNYVTYLGTLVGIPRAQFDRQITASAYVIYKDKAGNEYTVYAPYQNGSTSVNALSAE